MSMTNGGQTGVAPPDQAQQPQLMNLAQYVKDLSFENPLAPRSLDTREPPQINVSVNVSANPITETDVEVALRLESKAETPNGVLFSIELVYAGVFRLQNVPPEHLHPLMMIECPRLLFPFAREIIATSVRNGGFPPLMLEPIDFVALYQQQVGNQPQAAAPSF
jgi:preprotein translocase subunit SecB